MAYKIAELATPVNTLTPPGRQIMAKSVSVLRTDTAGKAAFIMKGHQKPMFFSVGGVASNAGTTATLSIGTALTGGQYNTFDIKAMTLTAKSNLLAATADANSPRPDYIIYASYAETGTASSSGGPFIVTCYYED